MIRRPPQKSCVDSGDPVEIFAPDLLLDGRAFPFPLSGRAYVRWNGKIDKNLKTNKTNNSFTSGTSLAIVVVVFNSKLRTAVARAEITTGDRNLNSENAQRSFRQHPGGEVPIVVGPSGDVRIVKLITDNKIRLREIPSGRLECLSPRTGRSSTSVLSGKFKVSARVGVGN